MASPWSIRSTAPPWHAWPAEASDVTVGTADHEQRLGALETNFQRMIPVTDNHCDRINALNQAVGLQGVTPIDLPRPSIAPKTPVIWKEKIAAYLEGWSMPATPEQTARLMRSISDEVRR
jgi:hypothetical protein